MPKKRRPDHLIVEDYPQPEDLSFADRHAEKLLLGTITGALLGLILMFIVIMLYPPALTLFAQWTLFDSATAITSTCSIGSIMGAAAGFTLSTVLSLFIDCYRGVEKPSSAASASIDEPFSQIPTSTVGKRKKTVRFNFNESTVVVRSSGVNLNANLQELTDRDNPDAHLNEPSPDILSPLTFSSEVPSSTTETRKKL